MSTKKVLVIASLGCQLACIWSQLKPKQLGRLMKNFFGCVIWREQTHCKSSSHLLVAAHIKGYGRVKPLRFACLLSLLPSSSSTYCWAFLHWCENLLLWDSNIDRKEASLKNFPGTTEPNKNCWDIWATNQKQSSGSLTLTVRRQPL